MIKTLPLTSFHMSLPSPNQWGSGILEGEKGKKFDLHRILGKNEQRETNEVGKPRNTLNYRAQTDG